MKGELLIKIENESINLADCGLFQPEFDDSGKIINTEGQAYEAYKFFSQFTELPQSVVTYRDPNSGELVYFGDDVYSQMELMALRRSIEVLNNHRELLIGLGVQVAIINKPLENEPLPVYATSNMTSTLAIAINDTQGGGTPYYVDLRRPINKSEIFISSRERVGYVARVGAANDAALMRACQESIVNGLNGSNPAINLGDLTNVIVQQFGFQEIFPVIDQSFVLQILKEIDDYAFEDPRKRMMQAIEAKDKIYINPELRFKAAVLAHTLNAIAVNLSLRGNPSDVETENMDWGESTGSDFLINMISRLARRLYSGTQSEMLSPRASAESKTSIKGFNVTDKAHGIISGKDLMIELIDPTLLENSSEAVLIRNSDWEYRFYSILRMKKVDEKQFIQELENLRVSVSKPEATIHDKTIYGLLNLFVLISPQELNDLKDNRLKDFLEYASRMYTAWR